jgi:hypothetical protein
MLSKSLSEGMSVVFSWFSIAESCASIAAASLADSVPRELVDAPAEGVAAAPLAEVDCEATTLCDVSADGDVDVPIVARRPHPAAYAATNTSATASVSFATRLAITTAPRLTTTP